ncbi:uncharacterized protein LOC112539256 [Tetranychus urticae]|uniref:uncharacterized protein LOC112539256 n=1 Tax=Tetranychus urticae TaxID=32264 RepID=UPI000D65872D|nr:uncharacterized protein LOC112539256 [Tetranychus urticae]
MNANSNVPGKVTIKVKLSDEDYHDIVLDWSDESCEYKQQLFMRKLASFTRVPIEYFTSVIVSHEQDTRIFHNQETKYRIDMFKPVENETFMSIFSDGDCFCLNTIFFWSNLDNGLVIQFELESSDRANVSQCSRFWCQYTSTRSLMDKRVKILTNSELNAKLNAASERRHVDNGAEFRRLYFGYNINQVHSMYFHCRSEDMDFLPERLYSPNRG